MCHYDLTRGRSGRGGCLAPGSLLCSESPQPSEIHSGLEETVVGSKVRVHLVQSAHVHIHVHTHAYTHTGRGARGNIHTHRPGCKGEQGNIRKTTRTGVKVYSTSKNVSLKKR